VQTLADALSSLAAHDAVKVLWAAAYLAGAIPFGYLLARFVARVDVRAHGSGNIGATNVTRVVGKKLGAVTLVLDALKGFIPVMVARSLPLPASLEDERLFFEATVAFLALVGHCFPVWLMFRGGKGVATGLGVVLAHRPVAAAVGLAAFAAVFAVTKKVSVGSLAAALVVVMTLLAVGPVDHALIPVGLCIVLIVGKHHSNIRRILNKSELSV
jgi:glycerol-3-phosphate acyltransferase PlsY